MVSEEERQQWREKLCQHLKDAQFRQIPGFPIASDEAILNLSDPPYYTACPNPFMEEILAQWQEERRQTREKMGLPNDAENHYHREPFAADVSEGKNDPIYNAHSYHTKVPHKAIMRYILHYTEPGDIVLDGFCGTGMTGVAAQLCGDQRTVESLGYRVDEQDIIWEGDKPISRLGTRKAVLIDLSPAATFIAYNYNTPADARAFEREAQRILREVEKECDWMYETWHTPPSPAGRGAGGEGVKGKINYTVWSDVFLCPQCGAEMVFWDVAVDHENGQIRDDWHCPGCGALLSKSPRKESRTLRVERAFETKYDRAIGQTVRQAKQVPVLINYSVGKKRYEKRPDAADLALLEKIENSDIPYPFPTYPLPKGDKTSDPFNVGVTHVHHFYTRRNLWALAEIFKKMGKSPHKNYLLWLLTGITEGSSKLNRERTSGIPSKLSRTLYIASTIREIDPIPFISRKFYKLLNLLIRTKKNSFGLLSTQSSNRLNLPNNSLDYIFIDPPFGANLMYSELNFLWEAWLGVFTNNAPEAVVNKTQRKGLPEYQALMEACFREFYRVLKPGRWMTVEFHNSQNAVWNAIQEALLRAGFVIADVRTIDKIQGTFNQVNAFGAVKQDLIISAYKPTAIFEQQFALEAGTVEGAWEFVRQHLEFLPMPMLKNDVLLEFVQERAPYVLFDRMVAYHIQHGFAVPLSAPQFYAGLKERFAEREGMIFTYPQASQFDRLRLQAERVEQMPLLITDEKSAIQWLRVQLAEGPKTYSDLLIRFNQESRKLPYEAMPELKTMLEENFLEDAEGLWRLPDPSKESDLQALREKSLLREFAAYLQSKGKLKAFRLEAIRAGFSRAWKERNYAAIVQVANRLPERVFEDDSQLLMYADNARLRWEDQPRQQSLL
ncbi:DNA methylase [Bellilinea caldifistulae]|uniref:DNA methylase n=2 Tax=Bellilinea caldifistulae TaxID=360411 RepID=A0A0P6WM69_9CHLR|nr:DNA methylase [Bellilinea caldifistulae]